MNALVSVIIPTVKGEKTLQACLNAVSRSTYKNIQVFIICEGLERSAQRNIGISKAKGEYLLILDSDMLIVPETIEDCIEKIKNCVGIYLPEIITTLGWFAKLRNWERQFYTGTAVDVVRFVRAKNCPRFDERMSGPEDTDWDRQFFDRKLVSDYYIEHLDNVGIISYFKKKAYYAKSMRRFELKWPNDKILNFKWRCFGVFLEGGKWRRFFAHPHLAFGVMLILFIRGIIYLWQKRF